MNGSACCKPFAADLKGERPRAIVNVADCTYVFAIDPAAQTYSLSGAGSTPVVDWTYSSHINSGHMPNHLMIKQRGNQISIYANGYLLATAADAEYTEIHEMGLVVQSPSGMLTTVRFDNFQVKRLD